MKTLSSYPVPKWAPNLTGGGKLPPLVDKLTARVPSAATLLTWPLVLSGLILFLSFPTFAAYVPLTGVNQLWAGNTTNSPGQVGSHSGLGYHSCVLTSSGAVKCWGYNAYGEQGDNTTTTHYLPVVVQNSTNTGPLSGVSAIATGTSLTCALTSSGGVLCWGYNAYGQLGDNTTTARSLPVAVKDSAGTGLLSGVSAIATGGSHTCALTSSGGVQCWGLNSNGQLGDTTTTARSLPVAVKDSAGTGLLSGVSAIATGGSHTCALTSSGGVQCWGLNSNGQLGDTTTTARSLPVAVQNSTNTGALSGVSAIATGNSHTCALSSGGVQCWGYNSTGQLGDTTTTARSLPVAVQNSTNTGPLSGVSAIATGYAYTCALTSSGGVLCWGNNTYSQLGDSTTAQRNIPVAVKDSAGTGLLSGVTAIVTGYAHTCVLTSSGGFQCWGGNIYGSLGDSTSADRSLPVAVLISDTPPTATSVNLSVNPIGTPSWGVGETLKGNYTYNDVESDAESGTLFQWYQATDASCSTGQTTLAGATTQTYTLVSGDMGKYICFGVTPKNANSTGTAVLVTSSNTIIEGNQTITFNPPASGTAGGSATLTATATSGLAVTFASTTTGICTVSGTTVNYVGAGTCTVTADQAGDSNYNAAPQVSGNIKVTNTAPIPVTLPPAATVTPAPISVPPLPPMTLKLSFSGAGTGSLTSQATGIDCSPTSSACSHTVTTPTWVTLTATPGDGATFSSWSGDPACQSDGKIFVMADTACVATFELQSYELSVGRFGQGQVTGPGFDCPPDCTETVLYGTEVQLEAEADREWIHTGWKGRCDQTGKVKVTNAYLCHAVFEPDLRSPNLGDGNGDGVVDAYQPNVISLPDKVNGNYITFAVQPDTCAISDVYTDLPENYGQPVKNKPMPQGLIYFELACPQAQVSLYYHAVKAVKRNFIFRKYGPLVPGDEQTVGWYLLPNVTFEAVMVDGKSVVKASYTLNDGELGDSTGVDGRIVDPGGMMFQ